MSIPDLFKVYLANKEALKALKKTLHGELMLDTEYAGFYEEVKIAKEVLSNRRKKLMIGSLLAKEEQIKRAQTDIKDLKKQIMEGVSIVVADKATGEQLSLPFNI